MDGDYTIFAGSKIVAITDLDYDVDRANAQLMASAPDLLEALRLLIEMVEDGRLVRDTRNDDKPGWSLKQVPLVIALQKAKAAIEQAEGGAA
jgi:hypothetical protein